MDSWFACKRFAKRLSCASVAWRGTGARRALWRIYFASDGPLAMKLQGRVTISSETEDRVWRLQPDGKVWLRAGNKGHPKLITLDSATPPVPFTKAPDNPDMAAAIK